MLNQRQKRRARNTARKAVKLEKWIERRLPVLLKGKPKAQARFQRNPARFLIDADAPIPGVRKSRSSNGNRKKNAVVLSKSAKKFENALNSIYSSDPGEVQVQFWWLRCNVCRFATGATILIMATIGAVVTVALMGALIAALTAASGGSAAIPAAIFAAFLVNSGVMLGYQLVPNVIEALTKEVCVYRGKC